MKATNFMIVFTLAMLAGVVQAQSNSEPEFESEGDSSERKFDPVTEQCIADCGINIGCQAACVGVPNPGSKHIRETNACIKECLRTTNADTFPACQDRCISENFMAVNIERTVTTVKEDDNKTEDNNDTDTNAEEAEEASSGMSTSSVQSTAAVAFVAGMLAALFFI